MSEALLLEATHATGKLSAANQPVFAGIAGRKLYEHQQQPAPVEKAVYREMPKVAQLLDAHFVSVPRKTPL